MRFSYTSERNFQMLIVLLKKHNIRTVIASPGTTNVAFVASIQSDPFFKIYSAPDERSAAYIACGHAAITNEPVVITCTGATASRNYLPGLTEAYYRKLPVIAVTSARHVGYINQLAPQVLDRTSMQNDVAVLSVQIPTINSEEDAWDCNIKLNEALLLAKEKCGPVHINIVGEVNNKFDVDILPPARVIHRYILGDELPDIVEGRVAIYIGNHSFFSKELEHLIERFCEKYNACVLCDHTSNYHGKYAIQYNLISDQKNYTTTTREMDILIDIGEVSGSYMLIKPKSVWRVSVDGKIQDRFKALTKVFKMSETQFFEQYDLKLENRNLAYYEECKCEYEKILNNVPDLPFSNIWIAKELCSRMPNDCNIHFGILNSLRSWNFFKLNSTIKCFCNTGGFGIDGILSTLIGSALADSERMNYCIIGDLAFFYDINSLGNRHVGKNVRILLINNGLGVEFRNYSHMAYQFGEAANDFIAAAGHYGAKSRDLVRHYAEDLGFEYISATSKEEFLSQMKNFISSEKKDKPIVFEVFTNEFDESTALKIMNHIIEDAPTSLDIVKKGIKNIVGEENIKEIKKILKG